MGGNEAKPIDPKGIPPSHTPAIEEAKQNRRLIDRAERRIERERKKLTMSEKKYLTEIRNLAKLGKHVAILHV